MMVSVAINGEEMGRLTIDIPDGAHHHIRVIAANRGVTIKDYVMEKLAPDLEGAGTNEPSLAEMAAEWEKRREKFELGRGDRSWGEVIHDGHKW